MKPTKFGLTRDRTSVCKSCKIRNNCIGGTNLATTLIEGREKRKCTCTIVCVTWKRWAT